MLIQSLMIGKDNLYKTFTPDELFPGNGEDVKDQRRQFWDGNDVDDPAELVKWGIATCKQVARGLPVARPELVGSVPANVRQNMMALKNSDGSLIHLKTIMPAHTIKTIHLEHNSFEAKEHAFYRRARDVEYVNAVAEFNNRGRVAAARDENNRGQAQERLRVTPHISYEALPKGLADAIASKLAQERETIEDAASLLLNPRASTSLAAICPGNEENAENAENEDLDTENL